MQDKRARICLCGVRAGLCQRHVGNAGDRAGNPVAVDRLRELLAAGPGFPESVCTKSRLGFTKSTRPRDRTEKTPTNDQRSDHVAVRRHGSGRDLLALIVLLIVVSVVSK